MDKKLIQGMITFKVGKTIKFVIMYKPTKTKKKK